MGFGVPVQWGLGDKLGPQSLGTRQAQLILHPGTSQQAEPITLGQSASGLYWEWLPTETWANTLNYVLIGQLLEGGPMVPLVRGYFSLGVVRNP